MTTEAPDPQRVREALAEATGDDPGALELSPIEGGASRQTFLVSAGGVPRWVVRREPAAGMSFNSLEVELGAVKAADLAGVAVAPTVCFEPAGGRFGAVRARELGLVHDIVPEAELDAAVDRRIAELLTSGPAAVAAAKALIRDVAGESPKDVIGLTTSRIAAQRVSAEGQEGMRAFLQKRKPDWAR